MCIDASITCCRWHDTYPAESANALIAAVRGISNRLFSALGNALFGGNAT